MGLVSNYASLAGLLKPRPFVLPPTDELIELLESGVRPAAITKAAGTTRSSIYRRLDRAGYRLQGGVVTLKVAA